MDREKVLKIIDMARKEGLEKFSYEDKDGFSISFSFKSENQSELELISKIMAVQNQTQIGMTQKPVSNKPANPTSSKSNENGFVQAAPFVGTFYRSSSPGEDPFVKVGDRVKKGQVICILEAMKIMNEIEAERDGTIAEILVENESYVEFDQPLFKIQ